MTVKLNIRNQIINGSFEYFQRNITFATVANNTYTADRWVYNKVGSAVHTVARSADVPTNSFGIYSLLVDCTTAQASIASTDYVSIEQRIEGNMLRNIKGKKILLSFWVKATKTGTYCVSFRNATDTRSFVKEYTVNTTNTWEKKTIRLQHSTIGAWNYDNQLGMDVSFVIAAGSNFHTTENAWQNGNFLATANQVNGVDNIANDFLLSDIMLIEDNEGQTRDPEFVLAGRDIFEELQLCQRYFEKSYNTDVVLGTPNASGSIRIGRVGSNLVDFSGFYCQTEKRSTVSATLYSTVTGSSGVIRNESAATDIAASILGDFGNSYVSFSYTASVGAPYSFHFAVNAEL